MAASKPLRELRTTRKAENMCFVYFNKNCDSGDLINEKLLPDKIEAQNETELLLSCVGQLISANYDPTKFGKVLHNCVGNYTTKIVSNRLQLKKLLKTMCTAFNACQNFIGDKALTNCPHCDSDDEVDDDGGCDDFAIQSVIFIYYYLHVIFYYIYVCISI